MTVAQIVPQYCAQREMVSLSPEQLYEVDRFSTHFEQSHFDAPGKMPAWSDDFLLAIYGAIGECDRNDRQVRMY